MGEKRAIHRLYGHKQVLGNICQLDIIIIGRYDGQ
jgi:hypothetical protein